MKDKKTAMQWIREQEDKEIPRHGYAVQAAQEYILERRQKQREESKALPSLKTPDAESSSQRPANVCDLQNQDTGR